MKRYVVGTLLFSIVMFVQIFGDIPVFADTFVPTSSYDFTALADLGYALVGGAEFDFEGTPYVIDDYNSLSAEQKEIAKSLAAREFLKDYMESRGIAFEENGELKKGSTYYTIAFGLAGQEFFEAFQTATAAEQEDLEYNMPISPSRFADWAQYNKYWFNRYADSFTSESDVVVPNPDPNYLSYINCINGETSYSNYQAYIPLISEFSAYPTMQYQQFLGTIQDKTIYSHPSYPNFTKPSGWTSYNYAAGIAIGSNIVDINIYSSANGYYIQSFEKPLSKLFYHTYNSPRETAFGMICYPEGYYSSTNGMGYDTYSYYSNEFSQYYQSLDDLFLFLVKTVRHANIYVNGEAWALASDPAPANPTIPDFPDIINQETGELAYDIAMPKTSDYSGSFDLTSLFDAIREGIAGASDGDLATGSTIGSLDVGRTYTGENIDINDRVIDLTSSRVFDGTLTDDTTGRLPKPPVVPPAVSAGLGGVTVLAKYIDATQCILPEDLMTAFWGCVWILIMLGLIKNLHR